MIRSISNILRLFRISVVLARHDALFLFEDMRIAPVVTALSKVLFSIKNKGTQGERLARAFEELGPTFIKLGQALSIRPDLVGESVAEDLARLQDNLPPFSGATARAIIEGELGRSIGELFTQFEDTPVAAASIAQVHFATDTQGREVAVKVLRPEIEDAFARDMALFYWMAALAEKAQPKLKRLKLKEVVTYFEKTVNIEMDLRLEAAASAELKENFASDTELYIPSIDWARTARRCMTMERVQGIAIDDKEALLNAGFELDDIVGKAASAFFKQVFRDGFFHADMHPGNLFVHSDGRIIVIDFGIMGRLEEKTRLYLAQMLKGFLDRDYRKVSDVHFDAGYVPASQSRELFAQACRSIGEPIFGLPQNEISVARLLQQLFKVSEDFEMETQPQLLLLQKTMMFAEGVGRILNPKVNMWKLSEPLVQEWGQQHFGVQGKAKRAAADMVRFFECASRLAEVSSHVAYAVTPEGVRLHPDTVVCFSKGNRKSRWSLIALCTLVSVFTAWLTVFWLT